MLNITDSLADYAKNQTESKLNYLLFYNFYLDVQCNSSFFQDLISVKNAIQTFMLTPFFIQKVPPTLKLNVRFEI